MNETTIELNRYCNTMMQTRDHAVEAIENLLTPVLTADGFAIVQARFVGSQNRPTLQLLVERADGGRVNVDECAKISRSCSAIIDVEDAVKGAYVLEVSSPGIDRPLNRPEDFVKFSGQMVKIETSRLIEGRRRFHGKIERAEEDCAIISQDGATIAVPFAEITQARLAMSANALAPKPKKVIKKKI